jgi:GMP synthase-like glutamine amidotransferase
MILVVDMNFRKDSLSKDEFVLPIVGIARARGFECEIRHYTEVGSIANYDKIILSGTALKDNDFMEHMEKFDWIKDCNKPVLGICAGMEAIGLAFASKLSETQEIGMTEIETAAKNPLFSSKFSAYELHNYAVKPSGEFLVLAKSKKCVQAVKHKKKEVYGVLFHPEVRNKEVIERFLAL